MNHLRYILEEDPERGRLDRAALELATIQFPDLDPEPFLLQLNDLASRLGDRVRNFNDGRDFVETAQKFLFEELGFHGNDTDFFDPLNSCLNEVLTRRTGIAITLSLLYMEVGRRLHMPLYGIGLPRHFVVQYDDGNYNTYIDPYGGRPITARDCFALAQTQVFDPSILARVTKKQIVMRAAKFAPCLSAQQRFRTRRHNDGLLIVGYPEAGVQERGPCRWNRKRCQALGRLEKYLNGAGCGQEDIQRSPRKSTSGWRASTDLRRQRAASRGTSVGRVDTTIIRMHDSLPDSDAVLAQFNRLIQELLRGNMHRNTFRPWEVELLLDIESCNLRESSKRETLRRYQKAVQRHMEKGARLPLKLSEYIDAVKAKRAAQAPASAAT
jgi:hypothetical protein